MNVKISLAKYNGTGAIAMLETEECDTLELCANSMNPDPKAMCARAAEKLRKLAHRFDVLGTLDEPFKSAAHAKANRA